MRPQNPLAAYRSGAESTVSKPRIVQLLLDGAVTAIQSAIDAFELEDFGRRMETIHNQSMKAGAIVAQLRDALDLTAGGEFAQRLAALYHYVGDHVVRGNLQKDPVPFHEAKRHLQVIQEAWREMLLQSGQPLPTAGQPNRRGGDSPNPAEAAGFSIQV